MQFFFSSIDAISIISFLYPPIIPPSLIAIPRYRVDSNRFEFVVVEKRQFFPEFLSETTLFWPSTVAIFFSATRGQCVSKMAPDTNWAAICGTKKREIERRQGREKDRGKIKLHLSSYSNPLIRKVFVYTPPQFFFRSGCIDPSSPRIG